MIVIITVSKNIVYFFRYLQQYNCCPPPFFMILMTVIEVTLRYLLLNCCPLFLLIKTNKLLLQCSRKG